MKALLKITFVGALCFVSFHSVAQEQKPVKKISLAQRHQKHQAEIKKTESTKSEGVKSTPKGPVVPERKMKPVKDLKTN